MIDVSVGEIAAAWPQNHDWEAISARAVGVAFAQTPYAALATNDDVTAEVSITFTDDAEVHALNREWRDKDKPTNVLSFPQMEADELDDAVAGRLMIPELLLGDIILAAETCAREAEEKGIALEAHASHLVVHGMLHLLGYDHIDDDEAEAMESLERVAVTALGFEDPYEEQGVE